MPHLPPLQVTLGNLVVNFISLPGYFVGLLLIDRLGRKKIQLSEEAGRGDATVACRVAQRPMLQPPPVCASAAHSSPLPPPPSVGFVLVGILFAIMSAALAPLKANAPAAFIVLYGLSYLVSNAGPNLSTYVIPAEAFPTVSLRRRRSPQRQRWRTWWRDTHPQQLLLLLRLLPAAGHQGDVPWLQRGYGQDGGCLGDEPVQPAAGGQGG